MFAACGWKDAVGLGELIVCRTLMILYACFATLQQKRSGNSFWLIAHIAANIAESFVQTVPEKSPSTLALFFRPKKSMVWMVVTVVNTGFVFIICKEHLKAMLTSSHAAMAGDVLLQQQRRSSGNGRGMTEITPLFRPLSKPHFQSGMNAICGLKQYFAGSEPLKRLRG